MGAKIKPARFGIKPYIELMRVSNPIGSLLVYFPHVIGILFAACCLTPDDTATSARVVLSSLLLLPASAILHGAGCSWNDIVDAELDRHVLRTKNRPIPRGAVTLKQAYLFTAAETSTWLCILWTLEPGLLTWSVPMIILVVIYPYAKRFTDFPSVFLGVVLAYGLILGFVSMNIDPLKTVQQGSPSILGATACLFTTYALVVTSMDMIYAHQDLPDDLKTGIRSMAVTFRGHPKLALLGSAALQLGLLLFSGQLMGFSGIYTALACFGVTAANLWIIWRVDLTDSQMCWWWFQYGSIIIGSILSTAMLLEYLYGGVAPLADSLHPSSLTSVFENTRPAGTTTPVSSTMSSPASPAPPVSDENKGPWLLALFWTEAAISIIFVALRFYTRFLMRGIGVDDWLMLVALILFVIALGCCTVLVHYGLGRHAAWLPASDIAQVAKWNWIIQPFGIMDLPFVKLSISVLFLKLLGPKDKWQRWFLYVNMVLFTIVFVLASIFSFVQCNPPRALWEVVPGSSCWDPAIQANWGTFGSSYSAFLDFALALLPITILRGLQMSLKKKISLAALLSAGVLSGIFAVIKTIQAQELGVREDVTWSTVELYAWGTSEVFLNIVCGCIPTLKPLYEKLVNKKQIFPSGKGDKSYTGSSSNQWIQIGSRKSANTQDTEIEVERSYGYTYGTSAEQQV
ncbi:hypothetical protein G7054_g10244 [Neopestalotiopsis clavispora]|nr:hypothetical protein G7054_g10244 [Neopestalotiopsis clavispora]